MQMTLLTLGITLAFAPLGVSCAAAGDAPVRAASHNDDAQQGDAAVAEFLPGAQPIDPVEQLLDELERAAADLRAFTADVYYENWEDLLGRREIRAGRIIYRLEEETDATSFAVLFDRLIVGQRLREQQKHYVFSERWLAEIDHEGRQFILRELVGPGRRLDPLKLGEGPMPLPVGQRKDEVLARFHVELRSVPEEGPLARLENVDGLLLTPRQGVREAEDYQHIELFYDRETRLPVGINAVEINDNRKTVRLDNVKLNPELTEAQRAKLSIDEPDPREWSIDVQRLRDP